MTTIYNDTLKQNFDFGFSQELLNNQLCSEYVKSGSNGYLFHSQRGVELDEFIEQCFIKFNWNMDYLACWITSSHGRHLCDELYNLHVSAKLLHICTKMKEIYNYGLIYSDPSHNGTLNDTIRIRESRKSELL